MKRPMIEYIIEALTPTFVECMTSESGKYWEDYNAELDFILSWSHVPNAAMEDLNNTLSKCHSPTGFYNAACDVASCLESLCPEEYSGKFRY